MKKILMMVVVGMVTLGAFAQQRISSPFNRGNRNANTASEVPAAPAADAGVKREMKEAPPLNFEQTPADIVLQAYADEIGKTVLKDPGVPGATITLKAKEGQKLTHDEYLEAIEVVLEMNGIHLEPYGEKFIRAIPRAKARKIVGMAVYMSMQDVPDDIKDGTVVSVRLSFKYIGTEEAQKALEGFKSDSGLLQVFERTNSILVTDTWENIKRMDEVIRSIDLDTPVTENVFVRQIKNASANDIKTALEAIVQDSQKEQEKNKTANNNNRPTATPVSPAMSLLNRNRNQPQPQQNTVNESLVMSVSDADRGMIRGKVLILADERSNKLIIVTTKTNMDFFDKVIEQLDVETTPDTVVKVYRLKYADAEDVSDMINDLIGSSSKSSSSKGNQNANAKNGSGANMTRGGAQTAKKPANQRTGETKAGELSKDNTTVLADKRINGLVVMTEKDLVKTLETIIESMDVKLSQVLIETVIIEVGLGDDLQTGIDWVHGIQEKNGRYQQALGGGGGTANPAVGAVSNAANALIEGVSTSLPKIFTSGSAGITYALYSERLDLSAVVSASKADSRSKYIASPIVMTVDNKEATIEATQNRKFLSNYQSSSSSSYYGSSVVPQYESKDLGIKIKVTPKINPNGTVMLEIEEEYSQVGAKQSILDPSSNPVSIDTSLTRKMSADALLENMQTVVLCGLTETKTSESESGIPILKDIPWIGKWLFGSVSESETRSELLIFMTPYVLDDGDSAQLEAIRRKKALSDQNAWDDHGWSASKLADPVAAKEQLRRQKDEWKKQDAEHAAEREMENAKKERVKKLLERMEEEYEADQSDHQ